VKRQYNISFTYDSELLEQKQMEPLDLNFSKKKRVEEVLKAVLEPAGLSFRKIGDVYVIFETKLERRKSFQDIQAKKSLMASALLGPRELPLLPAITVTGRVTAATTGEPLPGVTVVVKGTTTGASTDGNGDYTINGVEPNAILMFSYVGFANQEIPVNNRTTINVSLTADVRGLSEVVVIGYGEKDRRMLTESIGTVTAQEIQRIPIASPDQALQGRVSGVQVTTVDGTPGAPVAVRIRGVGTVGNTQPLYVIDGIPVGTASGGNTNPLATINPSDIESMSVLKDASAAAVYGVRAANGVVLITTKRGRTGRPAINYDGYYGVQNFPKLYDWNNTQQYMELATEGINNRNTQFNYRPGDRDYIILHPDLRPGSPVLNTNTDWQRAALNENAPMQNHNMSVSGGSDVANFHVSVGYFKQEAMVQKWDLERYNFRVNGDYKVGKRFTFGQTFALAYQDVI
jgi:TonB-linked SusC/RagA family outer membrane protein